MKITQQQIRQIIKEELARHMEESPDMMADMGGAEDDMGFDVEPDEETAMVTTGDDMGIEWTQFDAYDADAVGAAFIQAGKDLAEENPDEVPTAEALVSRMLEILEIDESSEDMDAEEEDEAMSMGEENEEAEEGSLYESRFRKLAGLRD